MDQSQYLTRFGLSEREATIYLTLIYGGQMSLINIARCTGIHRPALYNILPKLEAKDLVKSIKKGKRIYYMPESPEKLEKLFSKIQSGFQLFLQNLTDQYNHIDSRPSVQYYQGKKGYNFLFDDIATTVPKNGLYYRYSARKTDEQYFQATNYYLLAREKKHLERRVITSAAKKEAKKTNRLEREIKTIPENIDLFDDNVSSFIYGDKIAFVDYDTQTTFIIHSQKIASFQKKLFNILWSKL